MCNYPARYKACESTHMQIEISYPGMILLTRALKSGIYQTKSLRFF
jgi:hypothetical protein